MTDERPDMIRCPECGASNRPDAVFCSLCLTRFDKPEPTAEEQAVVEPEPPGEAAAQPKPPSDNVEAAQPPASAPPADEAWAGDVEPFSPPGTGEPDDELAGLPLELQMELKRPRTDFDMRKVWMRAAIVVALAVVGLSLSIGILALIGNQKINEAEIASQQAQPVQPSPAQPQPTPTPAPSPGGPESHPDLGFTLPAGWTGSGTADSIALTSADGSMTIQIRSWQRSSDGHYTFVNGQLEAITENAALSEMGEQMVQSLYGSVVPPGVTTSSATAGRVSALMVDMSNERDGTYRRAYGFIHNDWTYLATGTAPLDRESELGTTMQNLLRSIQYKT